MVDLNASVPNSPKFGEGSKIKSFMGRTPGILRTKLLTVLGNSNELLNGIQNKLTLSSSSSDCDDDDEEEVIYDETIDYTKIDFESRRVKARRAHEEIISGNFRHPKLLTKMRHKNLALGIDIKPRSESISSKSSSSYNKNSIDSKSPVLGNSDVEAELLDVNGILRVTPTIDVAPPPSTALELSPQAEESVGMPVDSTLAVALPQKTSNSSTLTSLNDGVLPHSPSLESTDMKNWVRSDSNGSVPSWASSISLDSETEQSVRDFMKQFVEIMFTRSSAIGLELKSEFGKNARLETGRLWFARLVQAQRVKSKRVDESTFYSLVQYFAIVLFECAESEDYSPAKSLMNMCFTFYHEIEVPGCEPYREYLFTYLRQQPIWHSLRFWNAAFFDALQCQRAHRPVPENKKKTATSSAKRKKSPKTTDKGSLPQSENEESDSSGSSCSHHPEETNNDEEANELNEERRFQQTLSFGHLGTFTCNMHAFGLSKDLCLEFLKKHSTIAMLPKDQERLLYENINRMYHETDKWGAKAT